MLKKCKVTLYYLVKGVFMGKVFIVLLLVYLMIFTSCNKVNQENGKKSINKSSDLNKGLLHKPKKTNGDKKNKNLKDSASLKGEIILKDGMMKQIISKLDVYMSKLPPKQVELIKSLKIENFKSVYFVMNKKTFFVKIKGLDILNIIDVVNRFDNTTPQDYKNYKNIKYFVKNKVVVASDGKNSYISSVKIPLRELVNYDMVINKELKNLIAESKNNGFYVSSLITPDKDALMKNMPPFLKSLSGISLFSFNENGINKVRLLAKLTPKDSKEASEKLNMMYKMYLPMVLKQINGYGKLLNDKKDLTQAEKDAYKILIKEFKTMAESVEIKALKENLFLSINIKNLETAVTLVGVMAAMAIPSYISYIQKSKKLIIEQNFEAAKRFVRNELAKGETGSNSITDDAVKELNSGNKKSPLNESFPAFKKGTKALPGVIVISKTNLRNVKSGESVIIYAPKGNKKIYFDLKDVTIIKE